MLQWESVTGQFSSVETNIPCQARAKKGQMCRRCLDVKDDGAVDLFDCKSPDSNQVFGFDEQAGTGQIKLKRNSKCLAYF